MHGFRTSVASTAFTLVNTGIGDFTFEHRPSLSIKRLVEYVHQVLRSRHLRHYAFVLLFDTSLTYIDPQVNLCSRLVRAFHFYR